MLLFNNIDGKNDLGITSSDLGFKIGEMKVYRINKDRKMSICTVSLENSIVNYAETITKESYEEYFNNLSTEEKNKVRGFLQFGPTSLREAVAMNELRKAKKDAKVPQYILKQDFYQAKRLVESGIAYSVEDNGNGDVIINLEALEFMGKF